MEIKESEYIKLTETITELFSFSNKVGLHVIDASQHLNVH